MRIGIVGSGVSGLVCAHRLHPQHDDTLFEADARLGGHVNTVPVGPGVHVDTGFIVYNERTYPGFVRLLAELGVETQASDMSFGVRCDRIGVEWASHGLASVFADPRNLARPSFLRMLLDLRRFEGEARALLAEPVLGTQASGLDPGTDSLRVSVWFYPLTIQAGDGGVLVAKSDGANGWDIACEDVSGTGRVTAHLHRNGTTHEVTSSATIVANRWYLATLQVVRESVGAAGSVTLYVNGSASTAATILAASPTNITTTAACVVGALDTISSCKFDGYIDEVHIEVGVSTVGTDARGLNSHRHCFFMGTRNAVRQMRTLLTLHDCNFTLNATSWDTAEDAFAAVEDENSIPHALACDYAMVEIAPLRQHLQEMLRLRGIRLALNTSGEWTCTVDTQQAANGAAGWRDGVWENSVRG